VLRRRSVLTGDLADAAPGSLRLSLTMPPSVAGLRRGGNASAPPAGAAGPYRPAGQRTTLLRSRVTASGRRERGARYAVDVAQHNDLEARVAALETEVRQLADRVRNSEQDAAAARVLAGGADRDVTEIRGEIRDFRQATTSSFNATREDLNDLRSEMQHGFTEMRGKLDATATGQQQIVNLLNTLITQGDQQNDEP
jgi:chromosome segregation ATPase